MKKTARTALPPRIAPMLKGSYYPQDMIFLGCVVVRGVFTEALASHLIDLQADTLIVTGCTTSGCARGSVVDAFSLNFKVFVPHDAVYDRSAVSHAVNLFDMSEKYADVGSTSELIDKLKALQG